jgi:DNA polymerase-2
MSYQGFILSSSQTIRQNLTQVIFQGRLSDGKRFHWTVNRPGLVFFIDRDQSWTPPGAFRKNLELKNLRGNPVDALYFQTTSDLNHARKACELRDIATYEADINLAGRYLMERFIKGGVCFENQPAGVEKQTVFFTDPKVKGDDFTPVLKLLSIDIECSMEMDLYSIALYGKKMATVLMVDPDRPADTGAYRGFRNERELLIAFFRLVREYDPDAFIGWNLIGFDLQWLARKCQALNIKFDIGTDGPADLLAPGTLFNQWTARIPGRAALDGINMARSAFLQTEDYSLDTVAEKVLGRTKLIEKSGREKVAEINHLFHTDKTSLAEYNLEDARLVYEIFEKLSLSQLAVRRAQLTGLAVDRVGGSVAAFDFLYLPLLHRRGYVADTHAQPHAFTDAAPGGLVLDSTPGFFRNVAIFDFKSLYPSIIRTFQVDPLAANVMLHDLAEDIHAADSKYAASIIRGPAGLEFAAEFAILPLIIETLWQARDQAKQLKDATMSQAVKIIMNSFYGVLGTSGCRFYDPRLAGTITRTGHWILKFSRDFIENQGYQVIYGDTDSLFIHFGRKGREQTEISRVGKQLAAKLNDYLTTELEQRFNVASQLDIEFDKFFVHFFMPTVRCRNTGSKKRYAGLLSNEAGSNELYFAGMETTRRDWTALAKEFQVDLFTLLFNANDQTVSKDALGDLVRSRHQALYDGKLDDKLVYTKGISKRLKDYTKNVPPHVRAARMLDDFEGRIVRYVMTTDGPEPVQKRTNATYDYSHYSQKQLAPIADMVLQFFDLDYRSLVTGGKQLSLF